jgi:DNA-binding NtrC family response regulator
MARSDVAHPPITVVLGFRGVLHGSMEDEMDATESQGKSRPHRMRWQDPAHQPDDFEILWAARIEGNILFTGSAHALAVALRIHSLSGLRQEQFGVVDCCSPEPLLDKQLFDVVRAGRDPRVEAGGAALWPQKATLLLHEVGKLSSRLQGRLLEALEPAGVRDGKARPPIRIMSCTSDALFERVEDGTFNDRLFYRLNAIHIVLPPQGYEW